MHRSGCFHDAGRATLGVAHRLEEPDRVLNTGLHSVRRFAVAAGVAVAGALTAPAATVAAGPESKPALLYVASVGGGNQPAAVDIYPLADVIAGNAPKPRQEILGLSGPVAVAIDQAGDFYVADEGAKLVAVFHQGRTHPYKEYFLGITDPFDVAVGPDGTLYVANGATASGGANVIEIRKGQRKPFLAISGFPGYQNPCIHVDGANNLYVASVVSQGSGSVGTVVKYPPGSSSGTTLNLPNLPLPTGITVDSAGSGDIVVSGTASLSFGAQVNVVAYYGYYGASYVGLGMRSSFGKIAFTPDASALVAADGTTSVHSFSNVLAPVGAFALGPNRYPVGVAVWPADLN